jgi:calcineurin-like phosphoesterase family protein
MTYDKSTILFTHEPVIGLHLPDGIDYNIHGHLHDLDGHRGPIERDGHHILISIELMQYKPISLERLLEIGSTPKWFPEENRFWRAE